MSDEELEQILRDLYTRAYEKRMECLFEEPCPLYEPDDDSVC